MYNNILYLKYFYPCYCNNYNIAVRALDVLKSRNLPLASRKQEIHNIQKDALERVWKINKERMLFTWGEKNKNIKKTWKLLFWKKTKHHNWNSLFFQWIIVLAIIHFELCQLLKYLFYVTHIINNS